MENSMPRLFSALERLCLASICMRSSFGHESPVTGVATSSPSAVGGGAEGDGKARCKSLESRAHGEGRPLTTYLSHLTVTCVLAVSPPRPHNRYINATRHRLKDMRHIQVALFESTQMACELLSHAIESSCVEVKVVTTGVSSEFQSDSELNKADVAVISLALRDDPFGGLKLLRRLVRERPKVNCVVLMDEDNREIIIEAFRSGAVGVCGRDKSYTHLCKCIRCVSAGQVWANSRQYRYILETLVEGLPLLLTDPMGRILLTNREQEIVSRVAEGMRNREIAELLELSEHTVKNHLFRIFERLGISNRVELILYMMQCQKPSVANEEPDQAYSCSPLLQSY